jgi:drug/metabolite transporter (DMT)-like permease
MSRFVLTHRRAVALMVLCALLWSTAGVVTRQLESARSFEVTFWRSFFTLLSLLVILPLFKGRAVFAQMRQGGLSLWLSGLCWAFMFTAFMVALTLTTVANVLVTLALGPLMTALVARVFTSYRIPTRTWLAIALAGVGIVLMYGGQADLTAQMTGTLVALLVPIAGACNWTVVQHSHAQGHKVDLVPAVLVGAVISSAVTLPLAWPLAATPHDIALLAALGLTQLAVPCVLSVWCASVLKAPEISLLASLEIIFGILLAWAGAGEVPGSHVLYGGALVITALMMNELLGWRNRPR